MTDGGDSTLEVGGCCEDAFECSSEWTFPAPTDSHFVQLSAVSRSMFCKFSNGFTLNSQGRRLRYIREREQNWGGGYIKGFKWYTTELDVIMPLEYNSIEAKVIWKITKNKWSSNCFPVQKSAKSIRWDLKPRLKRKTVHFLRKHLPKKNNHFCFVHVCKCHTSYLIEQGHCLNISSWLDAVIHVK